jgi:Sucrose-6F-phosphate phosphohydrolase
MMERKGFSEQITVFAGDSGNDLPVLTSGMQAVLVRNATDEVRCEAVNAVRAKGCEHRLYLAHGGFLGMNGNYSAGVLEGAAHFLPQIRDWLSGMQG